MNQITKIFAALIVLTISSSAFASGNNDRFDDCNNCYNTSTTNAGGQGGQGGTGGNATANGGNAASNASAGALSVAGAAAGAVSSLNSSIDTNISQSLQFEAQKRDPVATAYTSLAAPSAPCMGSSSVGAQGVGFGVSVGSTWTSEECNDRENIRFASLHGDPDVAVEMMRMKMPGYAEAEKIVMDRRAKQPKVSTITAPQQTQVLYLKNPDVMARALSLQQR